MRIGKQNRSPHLNLKYLMCGMSKMPCVWFANPLNIIYGAKNAITDLSGASIASPIRYGP
jgi:hypothetical protein